MPGLVQAQFSGSREVAELFRTMSVTLGDRDENDVINAITHRALEPVTQFVVDETPVDTGLLRDSIFQLTSDVEKNTVHVGWAWRRESGTPFVKLIATEYGTIHRRGSATLRRAWQAEGGDAFIARWADLLEERIGFEISQNARQALPLGVNVAEPTRGGRPLGALDRGPRRNRSRERGPGR